MGPSIKPLMKIPDKFRILLVTLPLLFILFIALGWLLYHRFGYNAAELIYNSRKPLIDIPSAAALKVKMDAISSKFIPAFSWFTSWFIIMLVWISKQIKLSITQFLESRKKHTYVSFFFFTLAGAFILMWPSFYNGYPLLFPDSASYILAQGPSLRSIGYSFFIIVTSGSWSLWITVFAQSLLASLLIMRNTDVIIYKGKFKKLIPFGILILTSALTSLPKYVNWIMADLFTGLFFLGLMLFLLSRLRIDKILSSTVIILSLSSHASHILIGILCMIIMLIFIFIRRRKIPVIWNEFKKLTGLVLLILISIGFLNFGYGGGFRLSYQNSANFMITRLTHYGILSKTLDIYCPVKNWKFCEYRKEFKEAMGKKVTWFLWSPDSPINKLGGFSDQREQNEIVFYAFKRFFPDIIKIGMLDTFKQLSLFNDLTYSQKQTETSFKYGVYQAIKYRYPRDFDSFMKSRAQMELDVKLVIAPCNTIKFQLLILALALVSMCIFIYKKELFFAMLLVSPFVFILINALVVSFAMAPNGRFQGRVMWLISYCLFLSLAGFLRKCLKSNRDK